MLPSSNSPSSVENRFAELLQPIRDLTRNWDVDIARYLEDYLDELEKISITFDGGSTTMNFAEAAMMIQSSACVYSKKVEYLYSLVYQVLDLLANKKKANKAASVDAEGNDNDADFPNKDDEELLTLDDIREHKNIYMKDDENANKLVAVIPRCPLSLIPLAASEKGENPLLSRKGEVLGSRNDFKMNTSSVHASGTMLLDMAHVALLESSETVAAAQPSEKANGHLNADENLENGDPIANMSVDGNDIDMCEPADDVIVPCEEGIIQEGRDAMTAKPTGKRPKVKVKAVVDHWKALLDPHDPGCTAEKPLKKGRTVRIPISLQEEQTTRKRKRTKQADSKNLPPLSEIVFKLFYATESRQPPASQKSTLFKEFERSYWKEFKRRQMCMRKARKDMVMSEEVDDDQEDEDDRYHADGDDEEDDNPPNFPEIDNELFESLAEQNQIYSRVGNLSKNTSEGQIISTYEDLVRRHVESYMASAQEYAQITELSRRVSEWEDKISPKLREEETHEPFDIHKYGSTVLDNLSFTSDSTIKRIKFRKIVAGKAAFETCRLFLATLQLANSYNIQIESPGILEVGQDEMEVLLLSTRRHFEELAEYQAPSVGFA